MMAGGGQREDEVAEIPVVGDQHALPFDGVRKQVRVLGCTVQKGHPMHVVPRSLQRACNP